MIDIFKELSQHTMAKYYSTTHSHPFSWDVVASVIVSYYQHLLKDHSFVMLFLQGIFRRYPNPFATHVLSEDTLHRELREEGRVLYSRRFLTKTNRLPAWGERFVINMRKLLPLVEESYVDRHTRTIVTYTRNVGLSR